MISLAGDEFNTLLPPRPDRSFKGSFGTLGLVVGSKCYQGAACLSTLAALHSGVGIAVAFIPETVYIPFACKVNGAVIEPLDKDTDLCERLLSRHVNTALCGCGLGLDENTLSTVKTVLSLDVPAVIDGDGISALCAEPDCLRRAHPTVLTPHMGEFSRLVGKPIDEIRNNKHQLLTDFAVKYNAITVLKDSETLICDTDGTLYSLDKPCSALSKGGSGDVLAGITASFIAQGVKPIDAVISAVTLHNLCGRMCADKLGARFTQPEDFIDMIKVNLL